MTDPVNICVKCIFVTAGFGGQGCLYPSSGGVVDVVTGNPIRGIYKASCYDMRHEKPAREDLEVSEHQNSCGQEGKFYKPVDHLELRIAALEERMKHDRR